MVGFDSIATFKKFVTYLKEKFITVQDSYEVLDTTDKTVLGSINEVNSVIDIDYNSLMIEINTLINDANSISEE